MSVVHCKGEREERRGKDRKPARKGRKDGVAGTQGFKDSERLGSRGRKGGRKARRTGEPSWRGLAIKRTKNKGG